METVESSETNFSAGKTERKKTPLPTSRSKFRNLRRSHAVADNDDCNVANNHSASALFVSVYKCIFNTITNFTMYLRYSNEEKTRKPSMEFAPTTLATFSSRDLY